jgi:hypothetical protein
MQWPCRDESKCIRATDGRDPYRDNPAAGLGGFWKRLAKEKCCRTSEPDFTSTLRAILSELSNLANQVENNQEIIAHRGGALSETGRSERHASGTQ